MRAQTVSNAMGTGTGRRQKAVRAIITMEKLECAIGRPPAIAPRQSKRGRMGHLLAGEGRKNK